MFRKILSLIFIIAFAAVWYGCGGDDDNGVGPTPPPPPPRLVVEAHQSPGLNSVDHAVWNSIEAVDVSVGDSSKYNAGVSFTNNLTASMKALTANDSIFVRVEWNDNSEDNQFGQLQARWLNNTINWEEIDTTLFANEDRFYVIIDNGGPNGADCSALCHSTANASGRKLYGATGDDADVWHWKANRTGLASYAEDMHITTTTTATDPQASTGGELYYRNFGAFPSPRPLYMHPDSTDYTGPDLLEGIYIGYIHSHSWASVTDSNGVKMPGFYLNHLSGANGSRWDVRAVSEHDGLGWTVVFARQLTTADADDVDLSFSIPDSLQISIAIGNNSGMKHHGAPPFYMVFE
ncbi:MAG: ethylbenzene dehydrogenase-related protein [candidate division Zixibacteria bacterium]